MADSTRSIHEEFMLEQIAGAEERLRRADELEKKIFEQTGGNPTAKDLKIVTILRKSANRTIKWALEGLKDEEKWRKIRAKQKEIEAQSQIAFLQKFTPAPGSRPN